MVHNSFNLVVAGILPETLVVKVSFIKLDWTAIVAEHELLERHEAHVPRITFFISNESGDLSRCLEHRSDLELPDAAIDISEAHEGGPVLEHLRLRRGHRHHTDVSAQVTIVEVVVEEFRLVKGVEDVVQF